MMVTVLISVLNLSLMVYLSSTSLVLDVVRLHGGLCDILVSCCVYYVLVLLGQLDVRWLSLNHILLSHFAWLDYRVLLGWLVDNLCFLHHLHFLLLLDGLLGYFNHYLWRCLLL